ncbi:hypothetical protein ABW21_db0205957 [Orbilia brochopaga]|nr:hypothetical protein ABW21_db0205957 [Drechslerella brochopaga]
MRIYRYLQPVCCIFSFLSFATNVAAWWQVSVNSLLTNPRSTQFKGRPHLREITALGRCYSQPLNRGSNALPIEVEAVVVFTSPFNDPQPQVLAFYPRAGCIGEPNLVVKLNDLQQGLQAINLRALGVRERPAAFRGFRYTDPEVAPYMTELRGGQNGVWYLNNPVGKFVWLDVVDLLPSTAVEAAVQAGQYHDATIMTSGMLRGYSVYRDQLTLAPPRGPISDPFFGDRRESARFEYMAEDFQRALAANQPGVWLQKYNQLNNIAGYIYNNWAQLTAGGRGIYMGNTGPGGIYQVQPIIEQEEIEESDDERLYKAEPKQEQEEESDLESPQIQVDVDDYFKLEGEDLDLESQEPKEDVFVDDEAVVEQEEDDGTVIQYLKKEEYKAEPDDNSVSYENASEGQIYDPQDEYEAEEGESPVIDPNIVNTFFNTDLNDYTSWTAPPGFNADDIIAEIDQLTRLGRGPLPGLDQNADALVEQVLENVVPIMRPGRRRRPAAARQVAPPRIDDNESLPSYDFADAVDVGPESPESARLGSSPSVGDYAGAVTTITETVDDAGEGLDPSDYEPAVGKTRKTE